MVFLLLLALQGLMKPLKEYSLQRSAAQSRLRAASKGQLPQMCPGQLLRAFKAALLSKGQLLRAALAILALHP